MKTARKADSSPVAVFKSLAIDNLKSAISIAPEQEATELRKFLKKLTGSQGGEWKVVFMARLRFVALAVLGAGAIFASHRYIPAEGWEITHDLVRDVGIAMVISALLALTVDGLVRFRVAKEVAKDVAAILFHDGLHAEVVAELRAIQQQVLYRRNLHVLAVMRKHPTNPEVLRFNITTTWELENHSAETQEFVHTWGISNDKNSETQQARLVRAWGRGDGLTSSYSESNIELSPALPSLDAVWRKPVSILGLDPAGELRVAEMGNEVEFLVDLSDQEIVLYKQAVVGLTVVLKTDPGIDGEVIFLHRNAELFRPVTAFEGPVKVQTYSLLHHALLPSSGFTITWKPDQAVGPNLPEQPPPQKLGADPIAGAIPS